ncbi:MAG TPA: carbohydrate binding domain-containing protein, partial [Phototrophicaceae bacterium]|nr:carbohydrate binding domain-containing protein [Phototrophicaceae bacterium]
LSIRDVIDQHPDKLFIAFTTPPLLPGATTVANAARARRWAEYLTSAEYLDGHPNLVVFDIFSLLADDDDYLRPEYRVSEDDSHPNEIANQTLGPLLVDFVDTSVQNFTPGTASAKPEPTATPAANASQEPAAGLMIDDFEVSELTEDWSSYADDGAEITCTLAAGGNDSDQMLAITFKTAAQRYAACNRNLIASADWQETPGFRFDWRSETPGLNIIIYAWIAGSPFEVQPPLASPSTTWATVEIPWEQVQKASWASETDLDEFDPTRVESISFNVGDWDKATEGTIWLDNWQLLPPE